MNRAVFALLLAGLWPAFVLAQVVPAPAAKPAGSIEPLARDFSDALVVSLGKQIYEQDQRATVATDVARANRVDFKAEQIRGWIVVRDAAAERIRFVREDNGVFGGAFEVAFVAGAAPKFQRLGGERLTQEQDGQFRARLRAATGVAEPCSRQYAFIVLDHPLMDAFLIYALAKPTEPGSIVIGGHYRFVVSRDGNRGISAERMYRTCVTLPANASAGQPSEGVAITHLASMRPLETHVFLSLFNHIPIFVSTIDGTKWKVDGLSVEAVGKR